MLSALPELVKLEDVENASFEHRRTPEIAVAMYGNENKDMVLESMKYEDQ
jgi:hypothetical protein